MAGMITGPLAQVLAKGRDRFNQKISIARRRMPSLDTVFLEHYFSKLLVPIADSLSRESPDLVEPAVEILFDLSLDLIGKGYFDARYPAMDEAWRDLLPRFPHLLGKNPYAFAGAVTNTIFNLTATSKAAPQKWLHDMKTIGPSCEDLGTFLEIGKVIAWRSGMAHLREAALRTCRSLDPMLAYLSLGISPNPKTPSLDLILNRLDADPWYEPSYFVHQPVGNSELSIVAIAGAFRGFGGEFLHPPKVVFQEGNFLVDDDQDRWTLDADCFGVSLQRSGHSPGNLTSRNKPFFNLESNGRVQKGKLSAEFSSLSQASSYAANETTLAVTIPFSHSVYLIAEVPQ